MRPAIGALLLLLMTGGAALADLDAARYFTGRGNTALEGENWQEAEKNFKKALGEHDGYIPAILGLGRAAQGRGDRDAAIRLLEECLERARGGGLSSEEAEAKWQAEAILKKLDKARLVYRKIEQDYVAKLLDLARRMGKKDPGVARRCAERILRLIPDHAKAKGILKDAGPAPAEVSAAPAGKGTTVLFDGKGLTDWRGVNKNFTVENGVLTGRVKDGAYWINHKDVAEGDYTLTFEMRHSEDLGDAPRVALSFGLRSNYDRFDLNVYRSSFALGRYNKGVDNNEQIARCAHYEVPGEYDRLAWNTFRIEVRGRAVTIFVNDEKLFSHEAEEKAYDGFPAIVVQNCQVEFRKISLGK